MGELGATGEQRVAALGAHIDTYRAEVRTLIIYIKNVSLIHTGCKLYYIREDLINITLLTWFKMIFVDFATKKLTKRHICVVGELI